MALRLVQGDDGQGVGGYTDMDEALSYYESIDAQIKDLTRARDSIKSQIVAAMVFGSKKRVERESSVHDGKKFRATYTAPTRTTVDQDGLAAALGARKFAKVSTRVVDSEKLLEAVDKGRIDKDLVSKFITVSEGTPSVRFYTVDAKEGDDETPAED